jgi:molybdenum cofactor cytidylyltransferase
MVSGLILAAGQNKSIGKGKPVLQHEMAALIDVVVANLRDSKIDELILVLGHDARRMVQKLSIGGLKVVINPTPSLGISASLQRGLARLDARCTAVLVALGDMPLVKGATVDQLVASFSKSKKGVAVPVHDGQRGYPVILDKQKYFDSLLALRGNAGVEVIINERPKDVLEVKVKTDDVLIDVDSHEDLEQIKSRIDLPVGAYTFA